MRQCIDQIRSIRLPGPEEFEKEGPISTNALVLPDLSRASSGGVTHVPGEGPNILEASGSGRLPPPCGVLQEFVDQMSDSRTFIIL